MTNRRDGGALAGHPFAPSRFEGLIGAYHQSLETSARLLQPGRRSHEIERKRTARLRAPKAVLASGPCRSDRPHERRRR